MLLRDDKGGLGAARRRAMGGRAPQAQSVSVTVILPRRAESTCARQGRLLAALSLQTQLYMVASVKRSALKVETPHAAD